MGLLSELKPKDGSTHYRKRVGRGIGSGLGGYSGKGGKGQTQRSGGSIRRGFEGGQTPLHRRLPKFGFTNVEFANRFEIVNIDALGKFAGNVGIEDLKKAGFVNHGPVKILGRGKLSVGLKVSAHKFSASAQKAIEAAGGSIEVLKD